MTARSTAAMKRKAQSKHMRHVRLHHWMMQTAAWQDLKAVPRAIYVEIVKRYNGSNNGFIVYSVRQASDDLKISKSTAARGFNELQSHGFIFADQRGAFHWKIDVTGRRHRPATEWRLTEYYNDRTTGIESKYPTKDFTRWTKIQNTVSPQYRDVPLAKPYGATGGTIENKNHLNGPSSRTMKAVS